MVIDGKEIAAEILAETKERVAALGRVPIIRAVVVSPTPATESYLNIKTARAADAGMSLELSRLPDTATTEDVIAAILAPGADAVIVQLPLPASIDVTFVLDAIPADKDADVLSHDARALFRANEPDAVLPPVADAMREILSRAHFDVMDTKAVVIGNGWLVGAPCAAWLTEAGAHVEILTRESGDIAEHVRDADIIVSGAGSAGLIQPHMLKPGVAIIDAGTSESNGAIAGDADPACADVASVFTPVPGGVGPIAVACLFRNAASLLTRAQG